MGAKILVSHFPHGNENKHAKILERDWDQKLIKVIRRRSHHSAFLWVDFSSISLC